MNENRHPRRPMTDYERDMLLVSISQDVRRTMRAVEGYGESPGLIRDVAMLKERTSARPGVGKAEKIGVGAILLAAIAIIPQVIEAWRS